MRCEHAREAISAGLDGEDTGVGDTAVARHVERCQRCRVFAERAGALHRSLRVRPADAVPDLADAIVAAHAPRARSAQPVSVARWALGVIAASHLLLALPALLLGEGTGASTHVSRELGAWDVALSLGLLVAAWQPARARGLLPFAVPLAAILVGTAVADVFAGTARLAAESVHLLEVAGVLLLWLVARESSERGTARPRHLISRAAVTT